MMRPRSNPRLQGSVLALHLVALAGGLVLVWSELADVATQKNALSELTRTMERVDARAAALSGHEGSAAPPAGADTPLRGESAPVAGANLQDRVVSAIRHAGGTVTSSQLDLAGATADPPTIQLVVSAEVALSSLQSLLYDLEAGTPSLFLDDLSIDAATQGPGDTGTPARLKVSMTVSGYWERGAP